jgi:DNA-binding transcriptional LysR family regulator
VLTLDDYPSLALYARVVDLRSFSAAAREAGIAKSAVSRRVAGLEEALGVRLLARTTRALTVTEEGMRVYEHAAALVAAFAAAEDAAGERGRVRGNLRVNAPVTFGQMHLVEYRAPALSRARPRLLRSSICRVRTPVGQRGADTLLVELEQQRSPSQCPRR